ncbi:MAG TPA: MFS transporter [Isosphaeraceae bacterium]|jgi:MFS family permease|nr:MFS transporter [Isosphaeraceae bacterium]
MEPGKADGEGQDGAGVPGRAMVTVALLLAMTVTAMEQMVVSTAMPTIIAKLHGFDIYPWVISAYLLAATVSTPLYGKLADLLGRKRVLLFGLGLFSLGSILSGTSRSMPMLIAMRTIQGLGAGAVGPIVLTLLGDLFTLRERARVQGWFSAVWGLSSIAGPAIGGVITDRLDWPWVFYVSVPFAALAAFILIEFFHEPAVHKAVPPLDWAGAGLLTAGTTALLLTILNGPHQPLAANAALGVGALVLLAMFVRREHRAADPILPMDLMARPTILAAVVGSGLIGGILFGLDTFVPLFVQGVRGGSATLAGRALTPLFLAWAVSVVVAAKVVLHYGFRLAGVAGSGLIAAGTLALLAGAWYPASSAWLFAVGMVIIGLGMGPTSLSYILAVQHSVQWGQRGVATGAVTFTRTIGGALGVGLLGALLGWELSRRLAARGTVGIDVTAALRPETHSRLAADQLRLVQASLGASIADVFLLMVVLGIGCLACSCWLPRDHGQPVAAGEPAAEDEGLAVAASEL